jgi:hypothetical protein
MPMLPFSSRWLATCFVSLCLMIQSNPSHSTVQAVKTGGPIPDYAQEVPANGHTCSLDLALSRTARTNSEVFTSAVVGTPIAGICSDPFWILDGITNGWVSQGIDQAFRGCELAERWLVEYSRRAIGFKPKARTQWIASVKFEATTDPKGQPLTKKYSFTKAKGAEEADWYLPIPYFWILLIVHTRDEWEVEPVKEDIRHFPKQNLLRCTSQFRSDTTETVSGFIWFPLRSLSWTLSSNERRMEIGTFSADIDLKDRDYRANISFFANVISLAGPKIAGFKEVDQTSGGMTTGQFGYRASWRESVSRLPGD